MFLYKNGKFQIGNAEFKVPDGFYFSMNPEEVYDEELFLYAPNRNYSVSLRREEYTADTLLEIMEAETAGEMRIVKPLQPISCNGLKGYCQIFEENRYQYFEICLLLDDEYRYFVFEVTVARNKDNIENVMNDSDFKEIFESIGPADT